MDMYVLCIHKYSAHFVIVKWIMSECIVMMMNYICGYVCKPEVFITNHQP